MRKSHLLTLAVIIVVFLGIGYTIKGDPVSVSAQESPAATPVRTAIATNRSILSALDYTGTVAPARTVTLAPKITGQISTISVVEGDKVRAGDVLLAIDDEQLQLARLRLEAKVDQAQLNLQQQELEFSRLTELYEAEVIPQQQYDQAKFSLNLAAATLKEANAALKEASLNLSNAKLIAPNDGVVLQLLAEPGDLAAVGKPLLVLSSGHDLVVETQIIEEDLAHIHTGLAAKIHFPGKSETYSSKIAHIDPLLNPKSRSTRVKIAVPKDTPPTIMPGMSADITLVLTELSDTLCVPMQALVQSPSQETGVYVIKDDQAKWQPITTGISDNTYVEVLDGLTLGEAVVIEGTEKLYDNAPVFIFNDQKTKEPRHE